MLKNKFWEEVVYAESNGASKEDLAILLGRARAKKGMFEGDMVEGELEIGQISGSINHIKTAGEIIVEMVKEYNVMLSKIANTQLEEY